MTIRNSLLIFIITNVVMALMMAGPLAIIFVIGPKEFPFIVIPAVIIGLFWSFMLFRYFSSFFRIDEKGFSRYSLCAKKMFIKFEQVDKVSFTRDFNNKVVMVAILFRNDNEQQFNFQLSGNLFDLSRLEKAFEKYGYPVEQ